MAISMAELEAKISVDDSEFQQGMANAGQQVDALGGKARSSAADWTAASATMAAGAMGIGAGFASAISTAADFEAALSGIASVGGADAVAAMDDIRATAMELGATTAFSASEAASGMEELVKAGVPVADVLDGAAASALNLAAATGIDVPTAAGLMATSLNVFGDTMPFDSIAENATYAADVIAQAANASATSAEAIGQGMGNAGAVAASFGLSMDDLAQSIALMSNKGVDGAEAGTMLKSMLLSLQNPTKAQNEAIAQLGMSYDDLYDASGQFIGIPAMFEAIRDASTEMGLSQKQTNDIMGEMFDSYGITAAQIFFDTNADGWANVQQAMQNAGSTQEQASIRLDNLQGSMEALSGSVETVAIAFGSALIPVIRPIVDGINQLVGMFLALPEPIQTTVALVTAGAGAFLALGSAIAFIIGPFLGAAAAAGGFGPLLAPIASGLLAILGPLALVAAGLAALYVAYQTNFLGFADGVNAAVALVGEGLSNLALLAQNVATAFGEGGLSAALGVLASAFQTAWSNISTAISSIDWGAISAAVQTGLQQASDAITTWLGEQSTALQGAFSDVDWGSVGATILNGLLTAIAAVGAFNELLLTKGVELMQGLLTGITQKWPEVDSWLKNLATDIGATVGDLTQTLLAKGADLMGGLLQGITDRWPDVDSWLANLATDASETVGSLLETLTQQGGDLISGLWTAAQAKWDETVAWLGTISSLVTSATLTDAATLLTQQGTDVMQGLWTAAQAKWTEVTAWLGGLASAIVAAVGDLSGVLVQAGVDLIAGFVAGIMSVGDQITSAILSFVPDIEVAGVHIDSGGVSFSNPLTNPFDQGGSKPSSSGQRGSGGVSSLSQRASGGPVWSGRAYLVGEEGPELFVPGTSGTIIPNGGSRSPVFAGADGPQIGTYIANVTLRDERDMQNYVRQSQRSQRVMSGRGS